MAGNLQIIASDHAPFSLQCGPDVTGMRRGVGIKRQYINTGGEALNLATGLDRAVRIRSAVEQLVQNDGGDAEAARFGIEAFPNALRPIT
ncbi:hypothetical protein ASE69_20485 [Sphingomonas sp. Leaf208]|nr:hypothetical protein ASE69_20485 [Sphingomonas sp. Leaf208]